MKLIEATDPITQAKIFFEEGVRYYAENNKDAALESFQKSMKISYQYHHEILGFLMSQGENQMVFTLRDVDSFTNVYVQSLDDKSPVEDLSCAMPMDVPAPVNILSKFNIWDSLPKLNNTLYSNLSLEQKGDLAPLKESTCMLVYRVYGYYFQIGTGVLVSSEKILAAKHSFLRLVPNPAHRLYAIFNYTDLIPSNFYQIKSVECNPEDGDIAVLTTSLQVSGQRYAEIDFLDDLFGDYYIAHHAGGGPLQFSTGTIPTYGDNVRVLEFDILAHAGPLASGAGIFSTGHRLVAISPRRSIGLEAISRKPLLLSNYKDWLLEQLAIKSADEVQIAEDDCYQDLPPQPVDLSLEDLYCDSPETMTWRKLKPLAEMIFTYLRNLSASLRDKTIPCEPPNQLLIDVRDTHQYQHFEVSQRDNKTIFHPRIGIVEKDPKFLALLFSSSIICSVFLRRINKGECLSNFTKNRDAEFTNFAIDFTDFGIKIDDVSQTSMVYLDGDPTKKFHIWPLPVDHPKLTNNNSRTAVINAMSVLQYVIAYQIQHPIKLHY